MPKVVVDGVEYVPKGGCCSHIKIGDFVRVREGFINMGVAGKVIAIGPGGAPFLVEFAEPFELGHDGGGRTKYGHGRWYDEHMLRVD